MEKQITEIKKEYPYQFSYRTTGQFERLISGFKRHCSPTAISNIILSIRPELNPDLVFKRVAKIGTSHLIYWNMDLFKTFGGTSDFFTGAYLRMALHAFGIYDRKVSFGGMARPRKLRDAFNRGSLVLLAMHNHPKYKSHHVVCYGIKAQEGKLYLLLADGWKAGKTVIPYDELNFTIFFEVRPN